MVNAKCNLMAPYHSDLQQAIKLSTMLHYLKRDMKISLHFTVGSEHPTCNMLCLSKSSDH